VTRAGEAEPGSGGRLLWLALGTALLLVSNGRWIVPLASWFFAIGWLVYLRSARPSSGLASGLVIYVGAYFVIWAGIIPAPGLLYYLIAATYAVLYFLPFALDRLLSPRLPGLRATLVFPLAWVSVDLLISRWLSPYGSWASLAYTQSDHLALSQLASVTGIGGITFLVTWSGSVLAWMARPGLAGASRRRGGAVLAASLVAVLAFGELRLLGRTPSAELRAAALVPSPQLFDDFHRAMRPLQQGEPLTPELLAPLEVATTRLNDDLLERSRREARAGAGLIAWSETAGRVTIDDEPELLERAGRLAAEEKVVLLLALGVLRPGASPPFENKVVAIDATGQIAWQTHKAHPIVGAESPFIAAGDGSIRSLDTGHGRLGAVICHDLDFPLLLRRARRERIGLLVAPSDDWSLIATLHARMAVMRAVENGFTLLRPTNGGRSLAVDSRGRTLALLDFPDDALVAHLPTTWTRTVYGMVGDLFSWLCLLALAGAALVAGRRSAVDTVNRANRPASPERPRPSS
jgi:apolipoprotein N-acyltransferase